MVKMDLKLWVFFFLMVGPQGMGKYTKRSACCVFRNHLLLI